MVHRGHSLCIPCDGHEMSGLGRSLLSACAAQAGGRTSCTGLHSAIAFQSSGRRTSVTFADPAACGAARQAAEWLWGSAAPGGRVSRHGSHTSPSQRPQCGPFHALKAQVPLLFLAQLVGAGIARYAYLSDLHSWTVRDPTDTRIEVLGASSAFATTWKKSGRRTTGREWAWGMGWKRVSHDDAGAYFRHRIKTLHPTLMGLYHNTRAYHAEWKVVHDQYMEAQEKLQAELASNPHEVTLEEYELAEELEAAKAFTSAADAFGQAFIMVVNPALKELHKDVGSIFKLGPVLYEDIRLSQALWQLANAVRHPGPSGSTNVLPRLEIRTDILSASRDFIVNWGTSTYGEFEKLLLEIGHDATEQYPDK